VVSALRRGSQVEQEPQPEPKRVVRETTAAAMRAMLEGVVLNGTGTKAQLDGYTAAGKTGTAQKIDPATGRYSATQLIASFVGFAPINNPAITILVQLDSPVGMHEGGSVAAPVFKRIAEQALPYLNVPRDVPVAPATLRAARRSQAAESADVSDYDPAQFTPVSLVDSSPAGSSSAAPVVSAVDAELLPAQTVELAAGEGVSVPDLSGRTVRQVTEICVQLGINPVLVGAGTVQSQSPEPGTMVRAGASVIFQFGRPVLTQAQLRAQTQIHRAAR
jgi:cell division protein FtsI (penicillin-binding protein 3)